METLNPEDYTKEKRTINPVWANIFVLILFVPTVLIFGLPYRLVWGDFFSSQEYQSFKEHGGLWIFILAFLIGAVIHELIHGIFFVMYAKNGWKSIKFGIMWKALAPYCHCKEPLTVKHYIIACVMPAIFLGIIPSIVAICIGNFPLLVFGILFTIMAGGDFLIIKMLLKEDKNDWIEDHPSEAGFYIYKKKENG
ncbi:MAG: DUF3267 domain-containing protein [Tannerella sp.]|jgi:hypothetical protein|nr:DUF3267 domain-containing protein [Tannerella sp.]